MSMAKQETNLHGLPGLESLAAPETPDPSCEPGSYFADKEQTCYRCPDTDQTPPGLQLQVMEPVQMSSLWSTFDNSQFPEMGSSHTSWGRGPKQPNCAVHL